MEFESEQELLNYCRSTGKSYCSMTLSQTDAELGTLVLELFTDICPKTCANFTNLVKGTQQYCYQGSPIHRVVKGGYIQGGDVVEGSGKGEAGFHISDETFAVKHDAAGIVGMANLGTPHTASTQFYISLAPICWLDGKRVAFGKVLTASGLELLQRIGQSTLGNERPVPEVTISSCAMLHEAAPA